MRVCVDHVNSLVMWMARNLKLSTSSTTSPLMCIGAHSPLSPIAHNQLLCLTEVEGEVVVLLPVGCLITICDQTYHRCVVSKLNDCVGVVRGHSVVNEQGVQ